MDAGRARLDLIQPFRPGMAPARIKRAKGMTTRSARRDNMGRPFSMVWELVRLTPNDRVADFPMIHENRRDGRLYPPEKEGAAYSHVLKS